MANKAYSILSGNILSFRFAVAGRTINDKQLVVDTGITGPHDQRHDSTVCSSYKVMENYVQLQLNIFRIGSSNQVGFPLPPNKPSVPVVPGELPTLGQELNSSSVSDL